MRSSTICAITSTLFASSLAQSDSATNACSPQNPKLDSSHPCVEVAELEHQCIPKPSVGTQQQCLCSSGYFHAWRGCLECMHIYGVRSDDETNYLNAVMDKASLQYCRDGPSVKGGGFEDEFQKIMKMGKKAVEYEEGDKEVKTTLKEGQTVDVKEYYTRLADMTVEETSTASKPTTTSMTTTSESLEAKEVKETGKAATGEVEGVVKVEEKEEEDENGNHEKEGQEKSNKEDDENKEETKDGDEDSAAPKIGIATAVVLSAAILFAVL